LPLTGTTVDDAAPRALGHNGRQPSRHHGRSGTTGGARRYRGHDGRSGTTGARARQAETHDGRRPTPHPGHDGRRPTPHPGHDGRRPTPHPGHNGRRTPLQRGPCRVPGSPRREPREYGSVSGEASRIPSARASGFTAKAAADRTSMPIARVRRSEADAAPRARRAEDGSRTTGRDRRDAGFPRPGRGFLPL
jgi:hypothetical protein